MLDSRSMIKISPQLLLACLLLLSQTALVSHDIEHLGAAHNEFCAVYLSQDHSESNAEIIATPVDHACLESFQVDPISVPITISALSYASRAPPKLLFFS